MTYQQFRAAIEKAASVIIKSESYNCEGQIEGYASAYPEDSERFKARGKWYYTSKAIADVSAMWYRKRTSAHFAALLELARRLDVFDRVDAPAALASIQRGEGSR